MCYICSAFGFILKEYVRRGDNLAVVAPSFFCLRLLVFVVPRFSRHPKKRGFVTRPLYYIAY